MAEIKTAKSPQKAKPNNVKELRITKGTAGGHVVEHVYENPDWDNRKTNEVHPFGDDQGGEALAHVGKWMGVPNAKEEAGEKEHKGKLKDN